LRSQDSNDFISLASHELRTPLSITKWYTEILLDEDAGPLNEDQKKYLQQIDASNQRAIDLVRSLLNISRISSGDYAVTPEKNDVQEAVEKCILSLEKIKEKKKITCSFSHHDHTFSALLDKNILYLSIRTILLNAYMYSANSGTVEIFLKRHREYIECSIKDNGIGIPKIEQEKIFSKMFRASNAKDEEMKGSGLGLYIVKILMNATGGEITFSSKEGEGSIFKLFFPVHGMKKKKGRVSIDSGVV
jgi:signal transduction histidine kinase